MNTIDAGRQAFAVGAKRRMVAIEDHVMLFDPEQEVVPGIYAYAAFGHTPGHMVFEVDSGPMILGDAINNNHVAFHKPDWASGGDQDPELAAQTRQRLLSHLAASQKTLVGFHLPGGGIGRAEAKDGAYRFILQEA